MPEHRQPDITFVDKDNKTAFLIDISVPRDKKEQDKIGKHQDMVKGNSNNEQELLINNSHVL